MRARGKFGDTNASVGTGSRRGYSTLSKICLRTKPETVLLSEAKNWKAFYMPLKVVKGGCHLSSSSDLSCSSLSTYNSAI